MQFRGKIRGTFEKVQDVNAESLEEAKQKLEANMGNDIEDTAISLCEVIEIEEI